MKPIKGMNLDVSPDSQPQGTYRMARNWVYDAEFDGLIQAPGYVAKTAKASAHTVGYHVFENGDMVLLQIADAATATGDAIRLYRAATDDYVDILVSDNLGLTFEREYHLVSFRNTDDERVVIITDQVSKPLVFNIDAATQPAYDLNYLFPTRAYPVIQQDGQTTGSLQKGTYFFCVQYELEDGTLTDFGPVSGPYRIRNNNTGLNLDLSQIDTNYAKFRVGMIGVTDGAIQTTVVTKLPADAASKTVYIEGATLEEALLEELAVLPISYSSADALEFYDNRLYLGNVTSETETVADYQAYANAIQPIWEIRRTITPSAVLDTSDDPQDHRFMPDEVYAFYVVWVRDDGTYTQAYHIPGRPPTTHSVKIPSGVTGLSTTETRTVNETATLTGIINATGAGEVNEDNHLSYLKNDRNIFEPGDSEYNSIKYFHTRCTAKAFNNDTSGIDIHHGEMGFWQNDNENYPSDFAVGVKYNWNQSGVAVDSIASETLAGQPVRHHRMPSIGWMMDNVPDFDFEAYQAHSLKVRFNYVALPTGTKGAMFFHAKRTNSNNLVLTHTPIHFGAANTWSISGEGGADYKTYSTQAVVNARNANHPFFLQFGQGLIGSPLGGGGDFPDDFRESAGDPREVDGTEFDSADYHDDTTNGISTYANEINDRLGVHYNKAVSHAQDILGVRPQLPRHMYTRFEYMLIQEEKFPDEVEDYAGGSGNARNLTMMISDSTSANFYATNTDDDGTGQARRFVFDMTATNTVLNMPFEQSAILPCRNQRYIPAGVVEDEVKFDNRKAPECLYWDYKNIANTETPYANENNYHDAGDRLWYTVLNNPNYYGDTPSGDTDDAGFTTNYGGNVDTQRNIHGWHPQCWHTRNRMGAVQRLPFVNVNAMRFNCYQGYDQQDLVLCSTFMPAAEMEASPLVAGTASNHKTVPRENTHGDVIFSKTQYRVTAALGYVIGFNTTDENSLAFATAGTNSGIASMTYTNLTDDGTRNDTRGIAVALMKVPTLSSVDALLHNEDKSQHTETEYDSLTRPASAANTNDVAILSDFMRLNDWLQPVISDGVTQDSSSYKYRIARSRAQDNSADTLNFRSFAALDFFEQPRNRGVITKLQGYADKLLIHHEDGLFLTVGKESIQTTTGAVVLGSGDIFRVKPQELTPTEFGFAGTQDPLSAVLTPQGYFWVDRKRRKVFLYNGKVNEISNRGMRAWFDKNLQLTDDYFAGSVTSLCPGVQAAYDPHFNRMMLLIRDVDITGDLSTTTRPGSLTAYYGDTQFSVKDKVISYSFNNSAWVSMHDMPYNAFVSSADKLYGFQTHSGAGAMLKELNDFTNVADIQYWSDFKQQTAVPAQIDISFPANEPVQWQSYSWHTKVRDHRPASTNYGHIDLNKTFEKAAVYNDYQCSGDLTFTKASDVDVTSVQRTTLRHNGTRYQFNGFRDIVDDRTERFLDPDYVFDTTNLNASKDWYDQRRFKSTHTVLRLMTGTSTPKLLYLYDIDAKVRKAYR